MTQPLQPPRSALSPAVADLVLVRSLRRSTKVSRRLANRIVRCTVLVGLLAASRWFDWFTTDLGLAHGATEGNLLVSQLGFSMRQLAVPELAFTALIAMLCALDIFAPLPASFPRDGTLSFWSFASLYYFGDAARPFWHALWAIPGDMRVFWRACGYVGIRVYIVYGFFAGLSNLSFFAGSDHPYRVFLRTTFPLFPAVPFAFITLVLCLLFFRREYRATYTSDLTNR